MESLILWIIARAEKVELAILDSVYYDEEIYVIWVKFSILVNLQLQRDAFVQ